MSTPRKEGGSPGWNEFPELDSESAAPPPLQIVSWSSSPWQHQMSFDFESYRDCSSDYIPRNICSTRSSPDGDGEGLALSPLWKFSDVSYPSVHHPKAPNRFSPFPLTISVPPLTIDKITRIRISTVAWEDMECEVERFFSYVSVSYDEDENERLMSSRRRLVEKIKKGKFSFQKMLRDLSRDFKQYLELSEVACCKVAVFKELNIESLEELSDRSRNEAAKSLGDPQCSNLHLEELVTACIPPPQTTVQGVGSIQEVKKLKRDKSKRRCGKTAKSISLEDLEELSDRNRNHAANILGVSVTTLKRICRRHGIPQWPPTKRNEDERSMSESELKGKSLCVGVPEVAFSQTALTSNPLSDIVGPITMPTSLNSCSQQNSLAYDPTTICQSDTYFIHVPVSMQLGLPIEQIPKYIQSDPQCSNLHLEQLATADIPPPQTTVQGEESIAVKATFGEDLIKFDLLSSSQMVNLEEEVAKRLKLKHGNFKLKYMDEENDWVLIACDVDLKRCIDTMRSLGRTTIRMLVQPVNHGPPCIVKSLLCSSFVPD